jgi:hypothetical protein
VLKSGIASIGVALLVTGCASAPTGPDVTVLPGDEKTIEEFHGDDTTCRQWAAQQSGATATQATASNGRAWSSAPAQRSYDLAYAQCMYTKGNQVPITNSLQAGLVPVSRAWQEEAEKAALSRVRLTTERAQAAECTRIGVVTDDSLKDLRRKIMRAGGDTGVLAFAADDLTKADAEVFRCAAANAKLSVPAPPAGTPPAPPPGALR